MVPNPHEPTWARPALEELAAALVASCRRQVLAAARAGVGFESLARVAGQGVGDTTFGLDLEPEAIVARWAEALACRAPLSILTEDSGWRHLGPSPGGFRELDEFDHGGPRVVVDPVDGTRNLMFDLRSAWAGIGIAPAGPAPPRLRDLTLGLVQELPTSRAGLALQLFGHLGPGTATCEQRLFALSDTGLGEELDRKPLVADTDARVDRGFFPFFRYHPAGRVALAQLEQAFFERLQRHEGAQLRDVYDDQYISNTGQLVLLTQGKYRMIADLRATMAARASDPSVSAKPYDVAGAVVCARAAGAVVDGAEGQPLDTPLDASTPVAFVGYTNQATAERLRPHLAAVLHPT